MPPNVCGPTTPYLRVLVGEHQPGAADRHLGVSDAAVVADVADRLDGVEDGDVPVDRGSRIADAHVGNEGSRRRGGRGLNDIGCGHGVGPVWELDDGDVGVDGPEGFGDAAAEPSGERRVGCDRLAGFCVAQLLEHVHDRTSS